MIHVNSKMIRSLKGIFTPHRFTKFLLAFSAVPMYNKFTLAKTEIIYQKNVGAQVAMDFK